MNNIDFRIEPKRHETTEEYIERILYLKKFVGLEYSWKEIAAIIYEKTTIDKDESTWRKRAANLEEKHTPPTVESNNNEEEQRQSIQDLINEFKIERYKLNDINTQNNAYLRRIAREETIKEIAENAAKEIGKTLQLPYYKEQININREQEAILQLSDWHYGIEVNNYWNKFNPDICKQRVACLKSKVIGALDKFEIKKLHVVNLSDLIAGRIHASIRYESRCDVITQTINVAEILAEFMVDIHKFGIDIEYYDSIDNHSRLEPKKESSLDFEALTRVIEPLLESRIKNLQFEGKCKNVDFIESPFGPDIAKFKVLGYKVGAVHGHKDSPKAILNNITLMTQDNYDLILSAHLHHFACEDQHNTLIISNGSLMGTDEYAANLRLNNKPSQNLLILSDDCVVESIHKIVLD